MCCYQAWSLHKRECKPLSAARSLPAEPAPISFYDATGGWKLGFYRGESRSFVWVLRNFAYDGPESDRHVLLGGKELVRKDAQLTRQVKPSDSACSMRLLDVSGAETVGAGSRMRCWRSATRCSRLASQRWRVLVAATRNHSSHWLCCVWH